MIIRVRSKKAPAIPTASMGDIAFLIIIFFMTSTVFTRDKGLKMLLPEKTEKIDIVKIRPENIVTIMINPEGALKVKAEGLGDGLDLSLQQYDEVRKVIQQKLLQRDTLLVVSLQASKDSQYRNMIAVLDQIKMSRVTTADGRELQANKISLIPATEE
jgi:biopolymer transport protein ExbD